MPRISFAQLVISLLIVTAASAQQQTVPIDMPMPRAELDITLIGCVVKGEDGGYLLTDIFEQKTTTMDVPTPVGTTGVASAVVSRPAPARTIYWLDDKDELEGHVGHKVEVRGELQPEIDRGEIEVKRKDGLVELEVKSDGKRVVARFAEVPVAVGTGGTVGEREIQIDYIVRKVDVKSVRMLVNSCR